MSPLGKIISVIVLTMFQSLAVDGMEQVNHLLNGKTINITILGIGG